MRPNTGSLRLIQQSASSFLPPLKFLSLSLPLGFKSPLSLHHPGTNPFSLATKIVHYPLCLFPHPSYTLLHSPRPFLQPLLLDRPHSLSQAVHFSKRSYRNSRSRKLRIKRPLGDTARRRGRDSRLGSFGRQSWSHIRKPFRRLLPRPYSPTSSRAGTVTTGRHGG